MAEHTKGPWEVKRAKNRQSWGEDDPHNGTELAGTHPMVQGFRVPDSWFTFETAAEIEANARLIAAAPVTLSHLEKATDLLRDLADDFDFNVDEELTEFDNAIRKAKGE